MQVRALTLLCVTFLLPSVASAQQHNTARRTTAHGKATPTHSWFGTNLLANGGFEANTNNNGETVPGWKASPGFNVYDYGSVGSEWDAGLSGCPTCGGRYAHLHFDDTAKENSTTQTVDVAPVSADIDKGDVTADLSAWLGGFKNNDIANFVKVSFQDAAGKELGTFATVPVDTSKLPTPERGGTSLVLCQKAGPVPAGTRNIVVTWVVRATGASGDYVGMGDNLSALLSKPKA